ncbi:MAG: S-layer homology domain-containing protein [Veillonella dispar]|uniref:S-layer homology domain-containing protein n=1 Tax=Veillonella dispar TaxID=39778 RepID=UPI00280A550E|nr:S-layer homology domain-containing protein [Veillonella dispar]MDU4877466.1 S-layer homology domain-containing protein [Veillonella dispar]MDU4886768.1 S-layer homology domain-containing protein [Veillonella dispar]
MNKRKRLLTLLINGVLLSSLCVVASAADTATGAGNGVAYGTGSNAPKVENVAIGNNAKIGYSSGASAATGDIVVGKDANINNYASQGGSIAIGKNAKIENMAGGVEASFALGQTTYSGNLFSSARMPADPTKVVGSVAIGDNTFARTGSTMIGSHNYKGDLGDTTVDTATTRTYALNAYATTVGANSFTNGAFATNTGTYNIISSGYTGGRFSNPAKNLGATINGSLNSIESKTANSTYSGVANSIVGTANRTFNSNGSLIMGAGNEITNSVTYLSGTPDDGGNSAKELAEKLRTAVRDANGGGATMALGGGNKADYTLRTSMIGINNTVTGTNGAKSADNLVMGVGNTASNVQHLTAIGSKNTVSDANNTVIVGDNRKVTGANNSVIIGSSDAETTTTVNDAVAIGHNTEVSAEGGVALGSKSKATVAAGAAGYDISTKAASTDTSSTWKATASAVSVGDVANDVTRQITSVAAGTNDTDAVNVAQLKKVETKISTVEADAKKHTTVVAGDNTTVTSGTNANGGAEYKVAVNKDLVEMSSANFGKATDDVRARIDKDSARFFNGSENIGVTPKGIQIENTDTLEQANFTKYGMYASEGSKTIYYTTNGISAGDQIINNVKAGVADTDAVNVSQLKRVQDQIAASTQVTTVTAGDHIKVTPTVNGNTHDYKVSLADDIAGQITNNTTNINKNTNDIKNIKGDLSKIDKRVDKSVAGAAALAALHPLDFDPDAKWDFAAGYGHYRSGDAAAIGAFYRPNEDVQLSVGSTVGSDETVFNAGLSVKVGAHSGVSRSRVAIGKEVLALKKTVAEQNAQIQKLTTLLNGVAGTKMKADHTTLFPDIPTNHWAYEAVSDLSRRGLVEGYPDGTFGGDRMLTRYEFAQIVYRAIQDGVTVNDRLVTEFSPEMALFRVDTVAKNAKGEPTIERVRVNKK